MSAPSELLLNRLDRVKRTGPGRWIAVCPAHEDKSPSLSIREVDDGRLLLKCWAGCGVVDVVNAVGLRLASLFPATSRVPGDGAPPIRRPFTAADLIDLAAFESGLVVIVASDVLEGRDVSQTDFDRAVDSARRLGDIWEACHAR